MDCSLKFSYSMEMESFYFVGPLNKARFVILNILLCAITILIDTFRQSIRKDQNKKITYLQPLVIALIYFCNWLIMMAGMTGNVFILGSIILGKIIGAILYLRSVHYSPELKCCG